MISEKKYLVEEGLHKGAFSDGPAPFGIMDRYYMEHGYKHMGKEYREIYLNNTNCTEKANLKTILRYKVTDIEKLQHTVMREKRK